MKLLVLDDEPLVRRLLSEGLADLGHSVELASESSAALEKARDNDYDVIMLDVMISGEPEGLSIAETLRAEGNRTPIVMLTANAATRDIVHGLDAGADDYVTKPFHFLELDARLRALRRREAERGPGVIRCSSIVLDTVRRTVQRCGEAVLLTRTEFKLLQTLMQEPGKAWERSELRQTVWGLNFDPGTRLVDVHVANLRRKLEAGGHGRVIETVRGVGFRLAEPADA